MDDKVVGIKDKRQRKKPLPEMPDLDKLKQLSGARMSTRHMCLLLNISEEDFNTLKAESKEFQDTLERGRAEAAFMCATVILQAASGKLGTKVNVTKANGDVYEFLEFTDKDREQLKAAKEYLEKHAPTWLTE